MWSTPVSLSIHLIDYEITDAQVSRYSRNLYHNSCADGFYRQYVLFFDIIHEKYTVKKANATQR